MRLDTASIEIGTRAATIRQVSPPVTTPGPASQTIRAKGGMFFSACRRSVQPPQKVFSPTAIWFRNPQEYRRTAKPPDVGDLVGARELPSRGSRVPGGQTTTLHSGKRLL